MKRLTLITLSTIAMVLTANTAQAGSKLYVPDFPIVGGRVEVPINPFNLVTGAYQGRFVDQGINSFAVFEQDVASGKVTGKDLVRAAYMEYRATYDDLVGNTSMIEDVQNELDAYRMGRN